MYSIPYSVDTLHYVLPLQVCARCLGVPPEEVFISETSTDKVPNSISSGASMSTDLYGMAVKVGVVSGVVILN